MARATVVLDVGAGTKASASAEVLMALGLGLGPGVAVGLVEDASSVWCGQQAQWAESTCASPAAALLKVALLVAPIPSLCIAAEPTLLAARAGPARAPGAAGLAVLQSTQAPLVDLAALARLLSLLLVKARMGHPLALACGKRFRSSADSPECERAQSTSGTGAGGARCSAILARRSGGRGAWGQCPLSVPKSP